MKRKITFFIMMFLLMSSSIFAETTNSKNTTVACSAPTGYTLLECVEDKTAGDAFLVYKAETTSAATTATAAVDPTNSSNKAILFSNKNYGQYLKLNVTLPCNRSLGDYEAISFKVYSVAGIGNYQNLKVGINQNMFDVANNGSNGLTTWTTLERTFPTGFSAYSSLKTFTLEFGFRTSAKDYYIDDIMLKEKATTPPCGGPYYTVTLNPGSGTCASASVTETEVGSGVTLPSASPSAKCGVAGFIFAGWAQSAVTETTTVPTLVSAGAFALSQNTTLFAVYTNGTVYNSNPVCSVSLNGTISGGWLIMEDFEGKNISESLLMKNIFNETIVGTATVVANPTIADEKVAHVTIASGNYNTLLKLNLTLPVNKVLANYEQLRFDLYRLANDGNYKKMYIWVDGAKVFEDADYIQQAPATTWTAKTYSFTNLTAGNSFELALGISTDAGNYMIDNVRLFPKADTTTGIDSANSGIKVFKSNNGIGVYCTGNQLLEVYNIAGQKIKSIITTDGLNTIPVSVKGLVVLKIANSRLKIIL